VKSPAKYANKIAIAREVHVKKIAHYRVQVVHKTLIAITTADVGVFVKVSDKIAKLMQIAHEVRCVCANAKILAPDVPLMTIAPTEIYASLHAKMPMISSDMWALPPKRIFLIHCAVIIALFACSVRLLIE
jgi:hypothetical protein